MSMPDHRRVRCAPAAWLTCALMTALVASTAALPSYAANQGPIFQVKHVHAVEGAPPALAFELQRVLQRNDRSGSAPSDSESLRVRYISAGRRWRSGPMRVSPDSTGSMRSLMCVVRLADCDSLPHDVKILVESADGRVLARARWRFRTQEAPAGRASYVSARMTVPMPNPNPPTSDGRATIQTVHASWGMLKLMYRMSR